VRKTVKATAPCSFLGSAGHHCQDRDNPDLAVASGVNPRCLLRGGGRVRKLLTENSQFLRPPADLTIAASSESVPSIARVRHIHIGGGHDQGATRHPPEFADSLSGGPDFWEVHGVPSGDPLNLRAGPSAQEAVVGELGNGAVMRNLGCKMVSEQRWCRVAELEDPGAEGWVAGAYPRESAYHP
jgi:hypothetical protein